MKIESITLYLENLLPGIIILGGILALLPQPQQNTGLVFDSVLKSEFLLVAFFLSVAYMLGVISAVVSRMFVNSLVSEKLTRPLMLMIFSQTPYSTLKTALALPEEKSWRKRWHQAYRAALAYQMDEGKPEVKTEILRRREQGRLVRNLFFPLVIGSAAVSYRFGIGDMLLIVLITGVLSILLYSYAEYTTFAEAVLPFAKITTTKQKTH